MPRIMLTQFLCPQRHAAFAVPWDPAATTEAQVLERARTLQLAARIGDHCGICGGPIAPESRPSKYDTLGEALAALAALAREQLATRRHLDSLGLTVEKLP